MKKPVRPDAHRGQWRRKPITQVQPNKKQEQRRTHCRKKGNDDGAVRLDSSFPSPNRGGQQYACA